jgi:hypothetical protein
VLLNNEKRANEWAAQLPTRTRGFPSATPLGVKRLLLARRLLGSPANRRAWRSGFKTISVGCLGPFFFFFIFLAASSRFGGPVRLLGGEKKSRMGR